MPTMEFQCFGNDLKRKYTDNSWVLVETCQKCERNACVIEASPPAPTPTALTQADRDAICSDIQGIVLTCVYNEKRAFNICAETAIEKVGQYYTLSQQQVVNLAQYCISKALG